MKLYLNSLHLQHQLHWVRFVYSKYGKKYKNIDQNGFVLIWLLSILPILFSLILGLCIFFQLLTETMRSRYLCRIHLLRTQHEIIGIIEELLMLNKEIIEKKKLLKKLETKLALLSQNESLWSESLHLSMKIDELKAILNSLHLQQQLRFETSQFEYQNLKQELSKQLNQSHFIGFKIPILLKSEFENDSYPIVELDYPLEINSRIEVSWSSVGPKLDSNLDSSLDSEMKPKIERKIEKCSAYIAQKKGKLTPQLSEGTSL